MDELIVASGDKHIFCPHFRLEGASDIRLDISFSKTRFTVKEDFKIFTEQSFIAEVGGLLGLLLGASLYTMFQVGCNLSNSVKFNVLQNLQRFKTIYRAMRF